jgi:hypothetical protein
MPEQIETLHSLRQQFKTLFDVTEENSEVLLFRVSYAGPPTMRSMRRELDDVLSYVAPEPMRGVAAATA